MSVAEDYGISESEWQRLDADIQAKLIEGQAKLIADRQMLSNESLRDDDRDLRRRNAAVTADILGRDTHSCDDPGYEMEPTDDMRITIWGDVNSEETFKSILQNKQAVQAAQQPPPQLQPQPEPQPQPQPEKKKTPWWGKMLGTLGAVALGAGITYGTAKYFQADPGAYDITALPYQPGFNPYTENQ